MSVIFTYLGTNINNQNSIKEEIKCNSQSKNIKIKIYRTIVLPFDLYGCETWPLTLTEEPRLRLFENRVPRRIFGPKRERERDNRRVGKTT